MSVRLEHNFRIYWYGKSNLGRENMSVIGVPNFQWKNHLYIEKKKIIFFFQKRKLLFESLIWPFLILILHIMEKHILFEIVSLGISQFVSVSPKKTF